MQIRLECFCAKFADRQTDRQTNIDENITSLAEVMSVFVLMNKAIACCLMICVLVGLQLKL